MRTAGETDTENRDASVTEGQQQPVDVDGDAACTAEAATPGAQQDMGATREGGEGAAGNAPSVARPDEEAPSDADAALLSKINTFHDEREEEKERMLRNVLWLATLTNLLGAFGSTSGYLLKFLWKESIVPEAVLGLGFVSVVWSVVLFCSCLSDRMDLNEFGRGHPRTGTALFFVIGLSALSRVRVFPHADALEVPIAACGAVSVWVSLCPAWWPLSSTWMAVWLICDRTGTGTRLLLPHRNPTLENTMPVVLTSIGCLQISYGLSMLSRWVWSRRHPERSTPTKVVFRLALMWCIGNGGQACLRGTAFVVLPAGSPDYALAAVRLVCGVATLIPVVVILLIGRRCLLDLVVRIFERDDGTRQRDGAFVAELLETVPISVGQTWWVHKDKEDERFERFNARRNWEQGVVVRVAEDSGEFVVQLPLSQDAGGHRMLAASAPGRAVHLQLSSVAATKSKEELLQQAQRNLRCVEFEKLSLDLMRTQDSRNNPKLQAEWYALSRPVRPGERIDYFMSHSWHDDAGSKWEMLKKVAEKFLARLGRYPTFWLDKLCIPQNAITDALKVVPVNVTACTKVLVLCGSTYPSRLWCIWELFTLYAFASEATAMERLECAFLGDDEALMAQMKTFRVRNARCYDPNEEARLRCVIDAVGQESFNQRICKMARSLELEQELKSHSSTLSRWPTNLRGH